MRSLIWYSKYQGVVHACIHANRHTCTPADTHACTQGYMQTWMHACEHSDMHTPIGAYIHQARHARMHPSIHPYRHTYIQPSKIWNLVRERKDPGRIGCLLLAFRQSARYRARRAGGPRAGTSPTKNTHGRQQTLLNLDLGLCMNQSCPFKFEKLSIGFVMLCFFAFHVTLRKAHAIFIFKYGTAKSAYTTK